MQTIHYRQWSPPQSPLRIEFPPDLLHHVRLEGAQAAAAAKAKRVCPRDRAEDHSTGTLYGVRQNQEIRILAARSASAPSDPELAAMEPVGIFVCRARGEVFLTDDDLAQFEQHGSPVALVMAGGRAGFFVREPDGTVQAVRSHEEFAVADATALPVPALPAGRLRPLRKWSHPWRWASTAAAMFCLPIAALAYLQPLLPGPPLALAVREERGQLIIAWNARAATPHSRLEILDGSERSLFYVAPWQTSVTYRRHSGGVEVRLATDSREGRVRWEGPVPAPPEGTDRETGAAALTRLDREAQTLRRSLERSKSRAAELNRQISELTSR
jgi:hypothetical protein